MKTLKSIQYDGSIDFGENWRYNADYPESIEKLNSVDELSKKVYVVLVFEGPDKIDSKRATVRLQYLFLVLSKQIFTIKCFYTLYLIASVLDMHFKANNFVLYL